MGNDLVNVVTPVGELHWVNISGQGKENYNEDGYEYVATVHLTGDAAKALKDKIDVVAANPPKGKTLKSLGYKELMKDGEGNLYSPNKDDKVFKKVDGESVDITKECSPSGVWAFTFRTGTTFPDGKTKQVNVFNNAKRKVNMGERKIGNGTTGAISGKMRMFERGKEWGVSLFLSNIQIVKFVPYEGDAGFEEQDGDFDGNFDGDSFEEPAEAPKEEAKTEKSKPRL